MVFSFTCSDPAYFIYMGRDKYENEDLIKYAFPEDVWFHVDDLSSAHVYLRMPKGCTDVSTIPQTLIKEMSQLTKANSIEGCKQSQVDVVYTLASNLKKSADMDIGQVGFHDQKLVYKVQHIKKDKDIINKYLKTKTELKINVREEKAKKDMEIQLEKKRELKEKKLKEKQLEEEQIKAKAAKAYTFLENTNAEVEEYKGDGSIQSCFAIEEDFM